MATVLDQIADGDRVLTRWRFEGTHTGPLYGHPASGNSVSVTGFHVHRIVDGRTAEIWALGDFCGLLTQIDALSMPETASAQRWARLVEGGPLTCVVGDGART